jgi:hypothetical protein
LASSGLTLVYSKDKSKKQSYSPWNRALKAIYQREWREPSQPALGLVHDDGGELPSKISGFVDLSELPEDAGISYGGVQQLSPGVYAIVESAKFLKNKRLADMSDLFVPIRKNHGKLVNGSAVCYKYYLADVEGFIDTTVVIPDLGGQTNDYFVLKAREDWKDIFRKWLLDGDISDEEDDDDEDTEDMQDVHGNNWDDAESKVTDNEEEVMDDEDDDESTDEEED